MADYKDPKLATQPVKRRSPWGLIAAAVVALLIIGWLTGMFGREATPPMPAVTPPAATAPATPAPEPVAPTPPAVTPPAAPAPEPMPEPTPTPTPAPTTPSTNP